MFHSIAERPNTEHKLSFTYNTLATQGWNVKAKNELPETAYLPMALDTWWTPAPRLHCIATSVQSSFRWTSITAEMAAHTVELWIRSQMLVPVGRNCCSRMPEPDRYFKPRSVVVVVSQEGHGDARSYHLLGHAEAGYKKWKCMRSYEEIIYGTTVLPFLGSALPLSLFFVFTKRPPFPLALLIACWWRDSWRYGCNIKCKFLANCQVTYFTYDYNSTTQGRPEINKT